MKVKTAAKLVAGIALLAIGYVGGAHFGIPFTDSDKLSGDISMAKEEEDPDMLAMQEVLSEDANAQKQSIISTAILSSRIDVLDSLVENGVKATDGQKNLEEVNKYFKSLKRKTAAAKANFEALLKTNEAVINGDKVDNFQAISNKALLSFFVLDNALSNDKAGDMLDYTREIDAPEAATNAIAGWMAYCSDESQMKGDSDDVAMWTKVYSSLSDAQKQAFKQSKDAINDNLTASLSKVNAANNKIDISNTINSIQVSGVNAKTLLGSTSNDLITNAVNYACNQGIPAKPSK